MPVARRLPGPPLTNQSAVEALISQGVEIGIGCQEIWEARNLPFDVAWVSASPSTPVVKHANVTYLMTQAAIEAGGRITKEQAFAIGSWNVERLLGVERDAELVDLVATKAGDFLEDRHAKVVAIISPERQVVDIMED